MKFPPQFYFLQLALGCFGLSSYSTSCLRCPEPLMFISRAVVNYTVWGGCWALSLRAVGLGGPHPALGPSGLSPGRAFLRAPEEGRSLLPAGRRRGGQCAQVYLAPLFLLQATCPRCSQCPRQGLLQKQSPFCQMGEAQCPRGMADSSRVSLLPTLVGVLCVNGGQLTMIRYPECL